MTRITECQGCAVGDHSRHRKVVKKGRPGYIGGGLVCTCKGDCKERYQRYIQRRIEGRKHAAV